MDDTKKDSKKLKKSSDEVLKTKTKKKEENNIKSSEKISTKKKRVNNESVISEKSDDLNLTTSKEDLPNNENISLQKSFKFQYIKNWFLDICLLYKNFLQWFISKILIYFWWVLIWLLLSIPFLVLYSIFWGQSLSVIYSNFFNWFSINSADSLFVNILYLYESIWYLILLILSLDFVGILFILWWFLFVIIFLYTNILLINFNNNILDKQKIIYKNKEYLNYKKVLKFCYLTFINIFILLLPVLFFWILIWILYLFSWDMNNIRELAEKSFLNYFSIISLLIFIISLILLVYLFYRIIFSYFIFIDSTYNHEKANVFSYIKESFLITKKIKNFFKFITLFIIFWILLLPLELIWVYIKNNLIVLTEYTSFVKLSEEQKDKISSDRLYYYQWLEEDFKWLTDFEIQKKLSTYQIWEVLYSIFSFIFIYWIYLMLCTWFYRRELKK